TMTTTAKLREKIDHTQNKSKTKTKAAIDFARQAEKLAYLAPDQENDATGSTQAVEAKFITAQDSVIVTAGGGRLPAVPIEEGKKLNKLRDEVGDRDPSESEPIKVESREAKDGTIHGATPAPRGSNSYAGEEGKTDAPLQSQTPPSRTNPLFPPLPMARRVAEKAWKKRHSEASMDTKDADEFIPLEGGPDQIPCDVRYYARRVGLDCEIFDVQTEDGFIIELWHVYNPREYKRSEPSQRTPNEPNVFHTHNSTDGVSGSQYQPGDKKYPVLMIHGLLQSAGAYCTNDDDSLAFFLAKSGYNVWLGNNRCGFKPRHNMLSYSDPRMWAWNIRQMGVMDLPALISRVLTETGFPKLGLIAHSQGTTQTLVALAKEQRPEIGEKISVFCALAPAAYAGPLIGKMYFKFMRVISPGMFRAIFGIHAFIPFMMTMHALLPPRFYGAMGYRVFSFLFNWTDDRWERDLRDRMFQFAPVYVSAESMRWWLGRECFAKQKCILATQEEKNIEDREDKEEDQSRERESEDSSDTDDDESGEGRTGRRNDDRGRYAWYGPRTPPFAFWVCGNDALVDGRRLLRRFERGREPHVDLVHSKIIEGYEHLDVIWAMDAIEKVGKEVREVIWKTADEESRKLCRTPRGCGDIKQEEFYKCGDEHEIELRRMDSTAGEWSAKGRQQVSGGGGEGNRDLEREIAEGEEQSE
ncbi:alpha/beta-hydrolase, partial [Bimuria novae-zelandiae CBS 107.79]